MIQLAEQKKYLVQSIMDDHDGKTPLYKHLQQWQDLQDSFRYQLINSAMGGRWDGKRISNRTLRSWMKQSRVATGSDN